MLPCARFLRILIVCAAALGAGISTSWAQNFPTRPVKLVVPYVPGGGADTVARVMALGLTEELGQPVLVENRGGANSIIGTEFVANSPPDGYTLLICTTAHAINPSLYKLNFDTLKAFTHVTMHLGASLLLVVHPSVPANSVSELIALAKAQPGKLTFASYGTGSPGHLSGELFMKLTGTEMLHIPYKGSSPSIADVVAGRATMSFAVLEPVLPFVKSGHVRALAVVMAERATQLPQMPTIGETVPGFAISGFNGVCAPSATPKPVIERLNAAIIKVMTNPAVRDRLIKSGSDILVRPLPTPEFEVFVRGEVVRWQKIVQDAGVKVN
jgi:tripartite-type tricarboxylate transporter receptor subunit TctC